MRAGRAAIAAGAAMLLAAPVTSAEPPFHVDDPLQWGQALRIVEPHFPARALGEGLGGHIDVSGRVSPVGVLHDVEYSPGTPASGMFLDPLRRVIRQWNFQPPLGRDCQPSEQRVVNRVAFEVASGKPRLGVVLLPATSNAAAPRLQPLRREEPVYPSSLRRAGAEAVVYTRVRINRAGDVVSVEPRAYPRRLATREFEHEVIRALTQWRFPPDAAAQGNRLVCHQVRFRPTD